MLGYGRPPRASQVPQSSPSAARTPAVTEGTMAQDARLTAARMLAGLTALTVLLLVSAALVSSSPSACALCHDGQRKALSVTPHRAVSCYGCHLAGGGWSWVDQKGSEWFRMYPAYLVEGRPPTGVTRISRHACEVCHADILEGLDGSHGIRIRHSACSPAPARCDGCHSDSAHPAPASWRRRPDMAQCLDCHASRKAPKTCTTCHATQVALSRPASGTLGGVHGDRWERTHGMGDLSTCSTCHQPIECGSCHGTSLPHPDGFIVTHGKDSRSPSAKCEQCHRASSCDGCHGVPMPHPADFRRVHKDSATSSSDARCLRCHRQYDCLNCHERHAHPTKTGGSIPASDLPKSEMVP